MTTSSEPTASATPRPALFPTDLREAHEALADSVGPVHIRGAGTAADWAGAARPAPTTVHTTRLSGLLAYNPSDMTVAVRAGTPLAELQRELAEHGQRVAFDAARVRRGATVGGLVATADSGPLAFGYGSLRDLVIGATVVLADGTVARTGSHVIKNVAGYDLAKLVHGSYGSLGLLAEVVLRLHPIPAYAPTVRLPCSLDAAAGHAAALARTALEPVAVQWYGSTSASGALLIRLEGTKDGARARAQAVIELLGNAAALVGGDEADREWQHHDAVVDLAAAGSSVDHTTLRIGCRPSRLPALLAELGARCSALTAGLATGIATVNLPAEQTVITAAHAAVTAAGGTSVLRHRPESMALPGWGQTPSAIDVLRSVKNELDPTRRLCPGRFEAWFDDQQPEREVAS